ncbi:ABC transporter permease subunit [Enterococcus asini]|uniref:ABC transporter permease subunit n=1 Tax=Enterococcus asini TaxID=57732 RepID=UPI00288FA4FB|nr:ABC transporter permease subunit [Enterococcus asini]MDT2756199.1 ABC transporter permease subunit [Enterococcus asini]
MSITGYKVLLEGNNLNRIMESLLVVIKISLISLILGLLLGLVIGILRTVGIRGIQWLFQVYLEFFRVVPLLVLLFVFYYILPEALDTQIDQQLVSILVFVLWIAAEMSDLVRKALTNVPQGQLEIGRSLGFDRWQLYRVILLPQGLPTIIPDTLNLITRVIKSTSLLMMIGVPELIRVGTQVIENYAVTIPTASFWVYGALFLLYFALCFPLSQLAKVLERRAAQGGQYAD